MSLQKLGIKDEFAVQSVMVAIDELCGREPEPGEVHIDNF